MAKKNGGANWEILHEDLQKIFEVQVTIRDENAKSREEVTKSREETARFREETREENAKTRRIQRQILAVQKATLEGQAGLREDMRTLTRIVARRFGEPVVPVVGDIVQIFDGAAWLPAVVLAVASEGVDLEVFGTTGERIRRGVSQGEQLGQWRWKPLEATLEA